VFSEPHLGKVLLEFVDLVNERNIQTNAVELPEFNTSRAKLKFFVTVQPPPCVSLSPTLYQRNTDRNAMNTRPEGKPPAFARRSVAKRARRPPGLLDGVRSTTVEGSRFARWIDAFCVRS
jgi:hypothetical protein